MESRSNAKPQEFFSWIATIVGFIVDTVALIGLFSAFRLGNINTGEVNNIELPKINFGNVSLLWRDATLIILIYLAFSTVFFIKTKVTDYGGLITPSINSTNMKISFIAINFLILTVFLWMSVFIFANTIYLYFYPILAGWLVSTFLSTDFFKLFFIKESKAIGGYLVKIGLAYILSIPIITLLTEFLFNTSFLKAFGMASIWFTLIILYGIASLLIWVGLIIGVLKFSKWFYIVSHNLVNKN